MREVRGGDEIGVGRGARVGRVVAVQSEPVAELPARLPEEVRSGATALELDPGAHTRILPLEQATVAVRDVHRPRHDHRRVAPTRGAGRVGRVGVQDVGNHPGQAAADVLVGGNVTEPLREETRYIEVVCRGRGEHLRVARPAEPLVALRAVGRDVEEVAPLPPHDVVLELVQERVRGLERARLLEVG